MPATETAESLARRKDELCDQCVRVDTEGNHVSEGPLVATTEIEQVKNEDSDLRTAMLGTIDTLGYILMMARLGPSRISQGRYLAEPATRSCGRRGQRLDAVG